MSPPSEPPPDPALQRRVARPWARPETEFGVLVPVGILQFDRTEPSKVAVTALWAYSTGFEFFITRLVRPDGPGFEYGRIPPADGGAPSPREHDGRSGVCRRQPGHRQRTIASRQRRASQPRLGLRRGRWQRVPGGLALVDMATAAKRPDGVHLPARSSRNTSQHRRATDP